jgi:hypothetical protein
MSEARIPHSWIGTEVVVDTGASYGHGGGLRATLLEVASEGIALSFTMYDDEGQREETAFYPWTSVYRVRKV